MPVPGPVPLVSVPSVLLPVLSLPVPVLSVYWTKLCSRKIYGGTVVKFLTQEQSRDDLPIWLRVNQSDQKQGKNVSFSIYCSLCQFTALTAGGSRSAVDVFLGCLCSIWFDLKFCQEVCRAHFWPLSTFRYPFTPCAHKRTF